MARGGDLPPQIGLALWRHCGFVKPLCLFLRQRQARTGAAWLKASASRHLKSRTAKAMLSPPAPGARTSRWEEHTSELQSLLRNSYAAFCLKKNKKKNRMQTTDGNKNKKVKHHR